ncbi:MAG TPA: hypothetical protein P5134_05985 [Bacteroidales bacterium]|nr:hypothetical protein [Bacteroidales bacterium]
MSILLFSVTFHERWNILIFPLSLSAQVPLYEQLRLREGAGGKPARAEAAGDAAAKKRACKLFLPPCVPTACARGLGTGDRPRA